MPFSTIIIVGLIAGTVASLLGAFFLQSIRFKEIVFLPGRFILVFLTALGLRSQKYWGTVYDSATGEPLDPARVRIEDMAGAEINSTVTDLHGRYGFRLEKGIYKVYAEKDGYLFPSTRLFGKQSDGLYSHLYFGGEIVVNDPDQKIELNIPLDRVKPLPVVEGNRLKRRAGFRIWTNRLFRGLAGFLFWLGFILAGLTFFFTPNRYNLILLFLYLFLIFLRQIGILKYHPRGQILFFDGVPASYAVVRAYLAGGAAVETNYAVADKFGRYYLPVPNGIYIVKIEIKTKWGYITALTSSPFQVKNKTISLNLKV